MKIRIKKKAVKGIFYNFIIPAFDICAVAWLVYLFINYPNMVQ